MAMGVTLEDPDTVYFDEDVTVGQDTVIGPNTHLKGKTTIGARCRIDGSAYIENCTIGDDVQLYFSVVLRESELGNRTSVGPFAHLRGGTVLAPRAEIGNFVEVKKSFVGEHSKAKHLAYLGDAEVGRDSNIGAGTITCNYDGVRKHETQIGSDVKIGSDTMLVAPVKVGDGATTGAGSVVTKDVEPNDLVAGVPARSIKKS